MPPHAHYVEPYFGAGWVLFGKDPDGVSEVVNDIDCRLMNFWRVLQGEETFARFSRLCLATPFSEAEFRDSFEVSDDAVTDAHRFFVNCRQSLSGRRDSFASISRTRTRGGMNEQASAWLGAVDGLTLVHRRLERVVILERDANNVIRGQDGPDTLFYLDPTYLDETRESPDVYEHEMTREQHEELLSTIASCRGRVMISGYRSDLYDGRLPGWTRHEFKVANHASGAKRKREMTECLWTNF